MKKIEDFVHELLQVIDGHVLEIDLLSAVDVGSVCENTNRHPWSGDIWESTRGSALPYKRDNTKHT